MQVGGDKYFNVYCPEYGVDCRIFVNELGMPSRANWNAGAKTLVLEPAAAAAGGTGQQSQQPPRQRPDSAAGGRGGGGRVGSGGGGGRSGGGGFGRGGGGGQEAGPTSYLSSPLDPCSAGFCYSEWIASLADGEAGIQNPASLQPVGLPLKVGSEPRFPAASGTAPQGRIRTPLPCSQWDCPSR